MSSSSRRTSGPVLGRSPSPAGRFASPSPTGRFASPSLTRVKLPSPDPRSSSAVRSASVSRPISSPAVSRRTCMCSPTNHPGSFRCALHKRTQPVRSPSGSITTRRSAMTNSLVQIGTVEADLLRRALAALIRPSCHQQRRRDGFSPRPSRLSAGSA